jgi:LuxR family quorum-sensing transcriptional regulator LasR
LKRRGVIGHQDFVSGGAAMLNRFELGRPGELEGHLQTPGPSVASQLAEIRQAILEHRPLEPVVTGICRKYGFEQFVYGAATVPLPDRESRSLVWTTMPDAWVREYDREAFIEVDPRIVETLTKRAPFVWDAAGYTGRGPRVDAFLAAAARHGIRSGVVIPLSDPVYIRLGIGFNSPISPISDARRDEIESALGDLMLLGAGFHDLFVANYAGSDGTGAESGKPLSPREVQCLQMAARGMTSSEIGFKLDIVERTVNFHFANIVTKLGVLNRKEAIAVAVARGLIRISL